MAKCRVWPWNTFSQDPGNTIHIARIAVSSTLLFLLAVEPSVVEAYHHYQFILYDFFGVIPTYLKGH